MHHEFKVYGEVKGQARPRISKNGRFLYKPPDDRKHERRIKEAYINSGGKHFGDKPLMMIVISHRMLPRSYPKKVTSEPDTLKPDASNILKAVEDALNGIAYDDDKQIILPIPLKANRTRRECDYLEVFITDEIEPEMLEEKVKGLL